MSNGASLDSTRLAQLAALALLAVGLLSLLAGVVALARDQWTGGGACLGAAAIAFGLFYLGGARR